MSTAWVLAIAGCVTALGGLSGLVGFYLARANRDKLRAEGRKIDAESAKIGVETDTLLSVKITRLWESALAGERRAIAEAQHCRTWRQALEDHVDHLERRMRDADLVPPPFTEPPPFVPPPTAEGSPDDQ